MRVIGLLLLPAFVAAQIRVMLPPDLVKEIDLLPRNMYENNNGYMLGSTATFGTPHYGVRQIGRLVFGPSTADHCTNDYDVDGQEYTSTNEQVTAPPSEGRDKRGTNIVVVERGTCTFVSKVRVAEEKKNAAAVIVLQSEGKKDQAIENVIPADDGYGGRVNVPTVLLSWEDSVVVRKWVKKMNDQNGAYTDAKNHEYILAELAWDLPVKHVVAFDWWMSAGRKDSNRLFKEMASFFRELKGRVDLRPHYNIFPSPYKVYEDMCLSVEEHAYCSDDVEGKSQLTGKLIVLEALRQLCVRKENSEYLEAGGGKPKFAYSEAYLSYKEKFLDKCPGDLEYTEWKATPEDARFGEKCAEKVMGELSINAGKVNECMTTHRRSILDEHVDQQAWSPSAIRINGWRYAGDLSAEPIRRAVCSAFSDMPSVCTKYMSGDAVIGYPEPSGTSFGTIVLVLLAVGAGLLLGMYLYKRFITKTLQAQLREEVMLEVKSQMAEYTPLTNH